MRTQSPKLESRQQVAYFERAESAKEVDKRKKKRKRHMMNEINARMIVSRDS